MAANRICDKAHVENTHHTKEKSRQELKEGYAGRVRTLAKPMRPACMARSCASIALWYWVHDPATFRRATDQRIDRQRVRLNCRKTQALASSLLSSRVVIVTNIEFVDISRIIFWVQIFQVERTNCCHLAHIFAISCPMEVGCVARQYDYASGWIGVQPIRVELFAQSNVKHSLDYCVNQVLRLPVRHQLHTPRNPDPDNVGGGH